MVPIVRILGAGLFPTSPFLTAQGVLRHAEAQRLQRGVDLQICSWKLAIWEEGEKGSGGAIASFASLLLRLVKKKKVVPLGGGGGHYLTQCLMVKA